MKIPYLKTEDLLNLKKNTPVLLPNYLLDDNSWLEDFFGYSPFVESDYTIKDFSLDMSEKKPFQTEFNNVKKVYGNLSFLSDSLASDERLWAALCLTHFWGYPQYRWHINKNYSQSNINQHFFFGFQNRRSLTRNALARLWWIGRLTYDPTRKDTYELTKFLCENSNYISDVLERNTSNNKDIIIPFLSAIIDMRKENDITINRNVIGALSKHLNLIGGTYILDCLPKEKIYTKTQEALLKITKNTGPL